MAEIIQVEIVQGDIEQRLSLEDFRGRLLGELRTKTAMTRGDLDKEIMSALDRVIQKVRDSRRYESAVEATMESSEYSPATEVTPHNQQQQTFWSKFFSR